MITRVHFMNFRALRATALPLGRFTLVVGPNASGKSTALRAITRKWQGWEDASTDTDPKTAVRLSFTFAAPLTAGQLHASWTPIGSTFKFVSEGGNETAGDIGMVAWLERARLYSLHADAIARRVVLEPQVELAEDGGNLAGVLDRLRDTHPERFEALNLELGHWLPEFDRVLFDTPQHGMRTFLLRMREGQHGIPAGNLSQGTLLALAMLTLAYLPEPPPLVALEEPDHGLHPRLLRDVQDAMYRLAYPERFAEQRTPVQVVATTHSPYLLDLYRDQPEEVVIAQKRGRDVTFEPLADRTDLDDILDGAHLGDAWFSGVLGGVPAEQ